MGELNYSHTIIIFNAFYRLTGQRDQKHSQKSPDTITDTSSSTLKAKPPKDKERKKTDGQGRL